MEKNKLLIIGFLFLLTVFCSGCVAFFVGSAVGALGGYAISRDTIQTETDKAYDKLWAKAVAVAKMKGAVSNEDKANGYLEIEIDSSRVIVQLIQLTKATTRMKVSARRLGLPNMKLAQEIFVKILEETPESNS